MFIKIKKVFKQHMPAITAGLCCWIFLWVFTGSSCFIRSVFGIPCPGCGSTRAFTALCRGHLKESIEYHPLIFISVGVIAGYIISLVFKIKIQSKFKKKVLNIFLFCLVFLYLGVYIARMILLYPGTEPMTYLETSTLGRVINLIKKFFA